MGELYNAIFTAANGVWTLVGITLITWLRARPNIIGKINERRRDSAAERAGDFDRLRAEVDRLAARVDTLEHKVEECEHDRDEWRSRAITAEAENIRYRAYHEGVGESKQTAQAILSHERREEEKNSEGS